MQTTNENTATTTVEFASRAAGYAVQAGNAQEQAGNAERGIYGVAVAFQRAHKGAEWKTVKTLLGKVWEEARQQIRHGLNDKERAEFDGLTRKERQECAEGTGFENAAVAAAHRATEVLYVYTSKAGTVANALHNLPEFASEVETWEQNGMSNNVLYKLAGKALKPATEPGSEGGTGSEGGATNEGGEQAGDVSAEPVDDTTFFNQTLATLVARATKNGTMDALLAAVETLVRVPETAGVAAE
jgi:hypothetical protein